MLCIYCGCSDDNACVCEISGEACYWSMKLTTTEGVCSACIDLHSAGDLADTTAPQLILPGDPEFHL